MHGRHPEMCPLKCKPALGVTKHETKKQTLVREALEYQVEHLKLLLLQLPCIIRPCPEWMFGVSKYLGFSKNLGSGTQVLLALSLAASQIRFMLSTYQIFIRTQQGEFESVTGEGPC